MLPSLGFWLILDCSGEVGHKPDWLLPGPPFRCRNFRATENTMKKTVFTGAYYNT